MLGLLKPVNVTLRALTSALGIRVPSRFNLSEGILPVIDITRLLEEETGADLTTEGVGAQEVRDVGFEYGASYDSTTTLAINTAAAVFLPAANTNGAFVHQVQCHAAYAAGGIGTLHAHTAAPANHTDGDCLAVAELQGAGGNTSYIRLNRTIFIPAGKGLYFFNGAVAEATRICSVLYTLRP